MSPIGLAERFVALTDENDHHTALTALAIARELVLHRADVTLLRDIHTRKNHLANL